MTPLPDLSPANAYDIITKAPLSGRAVLRHAARLPVDQRGEFLRKAAQHLLALAPDRDLYVVLPVDVQTFVESPEFLDRRGVLYPAVMEALRELNSGQYVEAVLTGAIGTGKSTIALFTTAYQLYTLSCLKDPHRLFGLDPASEIVFALQSLTGALARSVDYDRFRSMIDGSPYFNRHFPFRKKIRSEMIFPKNIVVRPLSGNVNAAIGTNILGAILDEVNFMARVEESKRAADGGAFDQATEMYNAIVRRRKSRFMAAGGRLPGMICLVSSKRYPGEFTDRKQIEARQEQARTGSTSIFVYDRTLWQIKPQGAYGAARFSLFLGDVNRKPRILGDGDEVPPEDAGLVIEVPQEFRSEFERDMLSAIRDIAGSSTFALHPFIVNTEAVAQAFGKRPSILDVERTDYATSRPNLFTRRIIRPDEPRLAHVDLGLTGDSAGIAMGFVEGFTPVKRSDDTVEMMPLINIDLILEVAPPRNGEIEFENIRKLFYALREQGMNVKWISFDSYQSADSLQILRQKGFITGKVSMDKTALPYEVMKTAFYDGRVWAPKHDKALSEIVRLERNPQSGLIDHPQNFSKDCADAVAGVVYGLTYRRENWARYGISTAEFVKRQAGPLNERSATN
ncbi:MAG: hypothetical protein LCH93_16500 [Proteobacteria bacterium]|nr:hypothetical protein [Pseudomonadota bacterium]